jgi:hypothetical protein
MTQVFTYKDEREPCPLCVIANRPNAASHTL